MANRLLLDFDGTLIDCSRRLYNLFVELAAGSHLTYEQYWEIKRDRINQSELLKNHCGFSDEQVRLFRKDWIDRVEDSSRLKSDEPFQGVPEFLDELSGAFKLYLVTARQHSDRVAAQLNYFGWERYFEEVLVTQQRVSKSQMVRAVLICDRADILVGDTGEDVLAGKELGTTTVAVSSGFLRREILRQYNPDLLLETVVALNAAELPLT